MWSKQCETSQTEEIPEVLLQFIVRSSWRQLKSQASKPPEFQFRCWIVNENNFSWKKHFHQGKRSTTSTETKKRQRSGAHKSSWKQSFDDKKFQLFFFHVFCTLCALETSSGCDEKNWNCCRKKFQMKLINKHYATPYTLQMSRRELKVCNRRKSGLHK